MKAGQLISIGIGLVILYVVLRKKSTKTGVEQDEYELGTQNTPSENSTPQTTTPSTPSQPPSSVSEFDSIMIYPNKSVGDILKTANQMHPVYEKMPNVTFAEVMKKNDYKGAMYYGVDDANRQLKIKGHNIKIVLEGDKFIAKKV